MGALPTAEKMFSKTLLNIQSRFLLAVCLPNHFVGDAESNALVWMRVSVPDRID
jgi:hypothetical protein